MDFLRLPDSILPVFSSVIEVGLIIRFRRDNWTLDELLNRSTYKKSRKESNHSLFDANPYSPHSCYDSVLSPISVCHEPAREVARVLSLMIGH